MGKSRPLIASLVCWAFVGVVPAFAQGLVTTTEFDITITPDQIVSAIHEAQEFYPVVRQHIVSERFAVAETDVRKFAASFLKKVDDSICQKVFQAKQSEVQDLLDFLTARMRKYTVLRQLRPLVNNDPIFSRLIDDWEMERRRINFLPESEQAIAQVALREQIRGELTGINLSPGKVDEIMTNCDRLDQSLSKVYRTSLGQVIMGYEKQARDVDPKTRDFLRRVVRAADWAMIVRPDNQIPRVTNFVTAWESCTRFEQAAAAALPTTTLTK